MAYSSVVFFGDSLSDNGNLSALVSTADRTLPPPPYHGGAFSDGPVHADVLLELTGLDGENHALAAARAIGSGTMTALLARYDMVLPAGLEDYDINLGAQVDRFLDTAGDLSDTAAALMIGINDLGSFRPSNNPIIAFFEILDFADDVADAIRASASRLADAGIDTLIYYTLPAISFFPASQQVGADLRALGDDLAGQINDEVLADLNGSRAFRGVDIEIVQLDRLAREVRDDPTAFGFYADLQAFPVVTDPDDPTAVGLDPMGFDADQFVFFDDVHPSAAFHGLLAVFTAATLELDVQRFLGAGDDIASYGASRDFVLGGQGRDDIDTNAGRDIVLGGLGWDTLQGGASADILGGGSGADTVLGQLGDDIIAGGRGHDLLRGGAGDDLLIGGLGNDTLLAGGGDDLLFYTDPALLGRAGDTDLYDGKAGADTSYIALSDAHYDAVASAADTAAALAQILGLTLRNVETIELLRGRDGLAEVALAEGFGDADYWGFV
ncbi:hypothetical protein GE300_08635 [Rhodobacteraceae bacterium 2CG4]|uniref:Phospholipase/lecithinase/hemolysin n=1 Tax=Halovulum marinum TaxID=2662447 RepID=A0A6L5YZH9_9RHOB|nr:SGNH/GDSL hydrolase family protein [Halovulum marinum]MSU89683.1 hypothetical protein [Halovulum marinum]